MTKKEDNMTKFKEMGLDERYIKAADLSKIFIGTSPSTVASWADKGLLTRYRIGGGIYFALSEVKQMIEKSKEYGEVA